MHQREGLVFKVNNTHTPPPPPKVEKYEFEYKTDEPRVESCTEMKTTMADKR